MKRERLHDEPKLQELIGRPTLLAGEDRAAYDGLRLAIEQEINPRSFFDELRLQDLTDKIWEEHRIKRQQIALIQSARVDSLASLLSSHFGDDIDAARETARNYYSGSLQKVRKAQEVLKQVGITNEMIE